MRKLCLKFGVPSNIYYSYPLFTFMKIIYNEKIDKEMFKEVNKMGDKLSPIFGFKFPKVKFDKRIIPIAKITAEVFSSSIDERKAKKVIRRIYDKDISRITVYINTTPFSTWNVKDKYISISYQRNTLDKFFSTVCHELNHFMYDIVFKTEKYQDIRIKESVVVLNNFVIKEIEKNNWKVFSKNKEKISEHYKKIRNFKKTIEYARKRIK